MAVLFAMWVVTTLLCAMRDDNVGGKPLRPCGPPPLQGGGVPTMQQKFQSPEHRVSEPGTPSFKARNTQFQTLGTPSFKRLKLYGTPCDKDAHRVKGT